MSGDRQIKLAPSILSANFARLGEQVQAALDGGVKVDKAAEIVGAGADVLVVFGGAQSIAANIGALRVAIVR